MALVDILSTAGFIIRLLLKMRGVVNMIYFSESLTE